jgi:hypothetical protein
MSTEYCYEEGQYTCSSADETGTPPAEDNPTANDNLAAEDEFKVLYY